MGFTTYRGVLDYERREIRRTRTKRGSLWPTLFVPRLTNDTRRRDNVKAVFPGGTADRR